MTGTATRPDRLFRASGRSFVTASDHGTALRTLLSGPGPREVLPTIVDGGPDGVLLSPGTPATDADPFTRRGAPVPVVRADRTVVDEAWKADSGEFHRVVATPAAVEAAARDAIAAGAKGLNFGRNVRGADDPVATTRNLLDVVHGA